MSSGRSKWRRRFALAGASLATLAVSGAAALGIVRCTAEWESIPSHPYFSGAPRPLNIAHRGASRVEPEHTFEAYDAALLVGADVLELDVRTTADGRVVVWHDEDLLRLHGSAARIDARPLAELREATGNGTPLLLDEVFGRFPTRRLNIELKEDSPALARRVAELVDRHRAHRRVLIASVHSGALDAFRALERGVATSASVAESLRFYLCYVLGIPARPRYQALQLLPGAELQFAGEEFIAFAHRHGLEVHYWTVDDPDRMRELLSRGADGIMTNVPAELATVVAEFRARH